MIEQIIQEVQNMSNTQLVEFFAKYSALVNNCKGKCKSPHFFSYYYAKLEIIERMKY